MSVQRTVGVVSLLRRNRDCVTALVVAVAVAAAIALARDDVARLRPYLQVVAVLVVMTSLADRAAKFSPAMARALTSLMLLHLIGGLFPPRGDAPTFYETWLIPGVLKFDQLVHGYGGAVLTVAAAHLVVGLLGTRPSGWRVGLVALFVAQGFGAVNEMVEFLFGIGNANLHAGGLENTGWDLVFNLAGGLVGVGWLLLAQPLPEDALVAGGVVEHTGFGAAEAARRAP